MVDAAVGATFAVDHIHAAMTVLFQETLPSVSASLKWIPYGQPATFLAKARGAVDSSSQEHAVTLLYVRLMDLLHSHPELRHEVPDETLMDRFIAAIASHASSQPERHIVVVLCPSPPDLVDFYASYEAAFLSRLPRSVIVMSNVFTCYDPPSPYYDLVSDNSLHSPYTTAMNHLLALVGTRYICRVFRTITKVIVVDCDNTLWAGAVSEDGVGGLTITPAHIALQRDLVAQFTKGVLLCLCSRNVLEDVQAVFAQRTDMVLDYNVHVLLAKVNHDSKSSNIHAIVNQLNVGMDSVVFLDDSVVECQEVSQNCPGISVVQVPIPLPLNFGSTCWALDAPLGALETSPPTEEDAHRTAMYRAQLSTASGLAQTPLPSPGGVITSDTLRLSLGMQIDVQHVDRASTPPSVLSRLVQLCQRTNQFNCDTVAARKFTTEADVVAYDGAICYVHVTDRYGHYGLVGMLAWRDLPLLATSQIDVFLLSCRVLNRGIEHAMLQHVASTAATTSTTLAISFASTVRNAPARTFLESLPQVRAVEGRFSLPRSAALALHDQPVMTTTITSNTPAASSSAGLRGLPTHSFPTVAAFSAFCTAMGLAPAPTCTTASQVVDSSDACKFRRQQREAVKILQREAGMSLTPIWTTNNVSERRDCPQCRVHTIAITSTCSFERCRSCCYNIQKWLHRVDSHPHPKARAVAVQLLQDANVDIGFSKRSCQVHTNPRRANEK